VNTNVELELVFHEAIKKKELSIPFSSYQESYNFRQRLYRYREALRSVEPASPLSLVVDHFTFEVQGPKLRVTYEPTIWEKLNANESNGASDK
jgi:hypothetical protein